jgi:hypothetical protein
LVTFRWKGGGSQNLRRSYKPVPPAGQRCDKPGIRGGIAERLAQFPDGRVEPLLEVDVRVAPDPGSQLVPGDHLSRAFEKHHEDAKRLVLQIDALARPPQLACRGISLKDAEANLARV